MKRTLLLVAVAACSKSSGSSDKPPVVAGKPGAISGEIAVAADQQAAVANHVVFVSARAAGGGRTPPLAAKRLDPGTFPRTFELTAADQMVAGGPPLAGDVELTVRIDGDGDAMTRQPGDLVWKGPATVGGPPLTIVVKDGAE